MTKFFLLAFLGVAAGAAWAWSRWRQRQKGFPADTTTPPSVQVTLSEEPTASLNQPISETLSELGDDLHPVSLREDASGVVQIDGAELTPTSTDSGKADNEPCTEAATVTATPDTPPDAADVVTEMVKTSSSPPVTENPKPQPKIPDRLRETKITKPEATRRIVPERRGGGQMESEHAALLVGRRKRVRSGPQLRLICFKGNDRMWRVAVELPEDFSACGDIVVSQNGQSIDRVRFGENRWSLKSLTGSVEAVEARNDGQRWQLDLGDGECWLFKLLVESETEEGRLVSAASRGDYLAIAPTNWAMPESSGIQPTRERNVDVDGHVGYRFIVRDGVLPKLEFGGREFQKEAIQFRSACFTLVGERADAEFSEYQSPLFLKSPPAVCASDAESWSAVHKIVLGVAGTGRNKWKQGFKPIPTKGEIQLSEHLGERTAGWYFVRLYDANEMLIDSLYFAFAEALRSIRVLGTSALPGVSGHEKARLEFEHDAGASVELYGEHEQRAFNSGTAFDISPRCDCERIEWQISLPNQSPLKCTTRIERIWWALGSESCPPTNADWTDKPIRGKRADFFASSNKVVFVRLPCTNSLDRFSAGFTRDTARPYIAVAEERTVPIPLRDFVASAEVHSVGAPPFSIWVWQNGEEAFVEALRIEIIYECCFCQKQCNTDAEALSHAIEHEKEFIRELTYEELRRLNPELPAAIYQCVHPGCRFYARGDEQWATSVITQHITDKHGSRSAPAHITFRSVTDADEIRRNVERHLPQIFRCRCGVKFENVGAEDFAEHIFTKHRNQLFKLV